MAALRITMRLYEDIPDDAAVIEWIESLPKDRRGRQRLKQHIVGNLLQGIRSEKAEPGRVNGSVRPTMGKSGNQEVIETQDKTPAIADPIEELPDFPAVEDIHF